MSSTWINPVLDSLRAIIMFPGFEILRPRLLEGQPVCPQNNGRRVPGPPPSPPPRLPATSKSRDRNKGMDLS